MENRVFRYFHHPFWGTSILGKHPLWEKNYTCPNDFVMFFFFFGGGVMENVDDCFFSKNLLVLGESRFFVSFWNGMRMEVMFFS